MVIDNNLLYKFTLNLLDVYYNFTSFRWILLLKSLLSVISLQTLKF